MHALVLQSDFGLAEGTVAQMYGVSLQVDPRLCIYNLTHDIPAFDTWSASYSLYQTLPAWAAETVFVSVVDPGVGSDRRSVVARTSSNQYVVTPDNGTLTHVAAHLGITAVRQIDETKHRRAGTEGIHVFHGRDVYSYTGAKLAAGVISFDEVGEEMAVHGVETHFLSPPCLHDNTHLEGTVEIDDPRFGMVWSNIPRSLMDDFGMQYGDAFAVQITHQGETRYSATVPYVRSFSYVGTGEDLLYLNEIGNLAIASNLSSFIGKHGVSYGPDWNIHIRTP